MVKLSGVQYYGLLTGGLLAGFVLSLPLALYFEEVRSSQIIQVFVLLVALFPGMCHLTLLLEMWSKHRLTFILVATAFTLLGFFYKLTFFVLIVLTVVAPLFYGLWRLWSYVNEQKTHNNALQPTAKNSGG